jgi:hypothetical protein
MGSHQAPLHLLGVSVSCSSVAVGDARVLVHGLTIAYRCRRCQAWSPHGCMAPNTVQARRVEVGSFVWPNIAAVWRYPCCELGNG